MGVGLVRRHGFSTPCRSRHEPLVVLPHEDRLLHVAQREELEDTGIVPDRVTEMPRIVDAAPELRPVDDGVIHRECEDAALVEEREAVAQQ